MTERTNLIATDGYALWLADIVAIGAVEQYYSEPEIGYSFTILLASNVQLAIRGTDRSEVMEWRRELVEKWKEWNQ